MLKDSSIWEMATKLLLRRLVYLDYSYLDLDETFYVPSFRRNLVSISHLDKYGYSCSFGNEKVSIFQYSNMIGTGSLVDNLYKLDINISHINESLCDTPNSEGPVD